MDDIPIGAQVKALRKHRGLRIADIADGAGLTTRYLEMIEAGARVPSIDALTRIAETLGVPIRALITPPAPRAAESFADLENAVYNPAPGANTPDPQDVLDRLQQTRTHWLTALQEYSAAASLLPDLIRDATETTPALAAEIYALAEEITRHARPDLAASIAQLAQQHA